MKVGLILMYFTKNEEEPNGDWIILFKIINTVCFANIRYRYYPLDVKQVKLIPYIKQGIPLFKS